MTESPSYGTAAEEAARLFAALQDWAKQPGGLGEHLSERVATGSAECELCPVCRLISVVRSTSPEVYEHLAQAADSLAAALRAAVVAHEKDWARRRDATVERIDIG